MRRYIPIILIAILLSCKKEDSPQSISKTFITVDFAGDVSAKTILSDNKYSILWCPGDEIAVFYDKYKERFTPQITEPSPKAIFYSSKASFFADFKDGDYVWGIYPYNDEVVLKNNSVDMCLSSDVKPAPWTFAPGSLPLIGRSSDPHKMSFFNVCSGFALTLYRNDIQSIIISAIDNTPLAGRFNVSFNDDTPCVTKVYENSSSTVRLSAEDGVLLSGVTYYIPVLPCHLSQGIKITYITHSSQCDAFITGNRVLNRKQFVPINKLDSSLVFQTDKKYVNLSQSGTANCYIVSAPGSYMFNANARGVSGTSLGNIAAINVLWEYKDCNSTIKVGEIIQNATLRNGFAYFDVPEPMTNGNALIVARSADGTILWSWHIWAVKDYNPISTAQTYKNNAGVFMDRNLGMVDNVKGKQSCVSYQWGRKDPFPVAIALQMNAVTSLGRNWPAAVESTETTGTIAYSIKNPTTFLLQNDNNSDWLYTTDNDRWGSKKTDYDPCPYGWKVPEGGDNGPWKIASGATSIATSTKWNTSKKYLPMTGILTTKTVDCWYPACGYLSGSSFACMNQGINVGQWSSTHYKTAKQSKAYGFFSTSKTDNTSTSYTLACSTGIQVRCKKE